MEFINKCLAQEITEKKLASAIHSMTKGKASGHDGISTEFLQLLWSTIGPSFHRMLCKWYNKGKIPEGVTKGFISLIPKEGDIKDLNYGRPITILTAGYKVLAQPLQLRLQLILRDVISPEQTTFLLFRFILDNIILTQEPLHWTKVSRQPKVFLKLDFFKAYDKVSRHFFFNTMRKMGISEVFTKWMKFLFTGAEVVLNFNGNLRENFKVERGIR